MKVALWLVLLSSALVAQDLLTNASVTQLVKAGVSEEVILNMVRTQPAQFEITTEHVVRMKQAGVSDKIISAMISAKPQPAKVSSGGVDTTVEELGINAAGAEGPTQLPVELVDTKVGGMLKTMLTYGIAKIKISGKVKGPRSSLVLTVPAQFTIRAPDGASPEEYQMVPLTTKKDNREFVAGKGSITGSSVGVGEIAIPMKLERIGRNLYRATVSDLKPGEYGILPPGALSPPSTGKIYTFRVQ